MLAAWTAVTALGTGMWPVLVPYLVPLVTSASTIGTLLLALGSVLLDILVVIWRTLRSIRRVYLALALMALVLVFYVWPCWNILGMLDRELAKVKHDHRTSNCNDEKYTFDFQQDCRKAERMLNTPRFWLVHDAWCAWAWDQLTGFLSSLFLRGSLVCIVIAATTYVAAQRVTKTTYARDFDLLHKS